ncbi:MAG: ATP-binding protein [Planctomycetaceae bacterium]|nr:ATP-binding protein [Planctomycetaceae bacterium]
MSENDATFIGTVEAVRGSAVSVRLRTHLPTLVMIEGQSYRIGQIGAFVRVPLGYTQLYAVTTLVGAAPVTEAEEQIEIKHEPGQKWMSVTLFGEAVGDSFDRGVSQYPTVGDEVHLVTLGDMKRIYGTLKGERSIVVGNIAAASGIPACLDLPKLISRHTAVVGSTGSGKSNLVAVLLEAIAGQSLPSSRVLLIDPHGEYASALGDYAKVFRISPDSDKGEQPLYIPFWSLPFDDLRNIALGTLGMHDTPLRDMITERKVKAAIHLSSRPPDAKIIADSPIPYSLKQLWFDLIDFERQTFLKPKGEQPTAVDKAGDPELLTPNEYPKPNPGGQPPHSNPGARHLDKQLDLLKSRLIDKQYAFMFQPGPELTPSVNGETKGDLDSLVASWVGHKKPLTILDVSGVPPELLSLVVGTMLKVIYDLLFWAAPLPVSGRNQPLLIVLEEAHLFLPAKGDTLAHRTVARIAKEGRKYGIGICVVTQRPTELDTTILSQCGTILALRLSNEQDRSIVKSALPDDLGALSGMLPSLRTGEAIAVGEAVAIPSRMMFRRARRRPRGDDPQMPEAWQQDRPCPWYYFEALSRWRSQSIN